MISAYMFQHYCQMNSSDNALKDSPWHLNTPKVSFGAYSWFIYSFQGWARISELFIHASVERLVMKVMWNETLSQVKRG